MMLKALTLIPLTVFLAACQPKAIELGKEPPPAQRLVCAEMPAPPNVLPLQVIMLEDGRQAYLKKEVDSRDGEIARYIVRLGNAWFECRNQVEWHADYWTE